MLAVFQEERAPATTALLSPSTHLHPSPPHITSCLSRANPIFSLPVFSSPCVLACLVIRSSIGVLVPAHSSLLNTTAMTISLKTTYSLVAAEAQLVQQEKGISGNGPFRSCSIMANLLNRFTWWIVVAADIKTCWTIFSANNSNFLKNLLIS